MISWQRYTQKHVSTSGMPYALLKYVVDLFFVCQDRKLKFSATV